MDDVLDRIAGWERDGLIDPPTAERLRGAETARSAGRDGGRPTVAGAAADAAGEPATAPGVVPTEGRPVVADGVAASPARREPLSIASVFGPGVTIAEMFGYLGSGFLLGAWTAFVARIAGSDEATDRLGFGGLITAAGLVLLAFALGTADRRRRRAAGVALLVALGYVSASLAAVLARQSLDPLLLALLATAGTVAAAVLFRRWLPALLTTFGLLVAITAFGWAVIQWAASLVAPEPFDGFVNPDRPPGRELPVILVQAAGWLLVALVMGFLAIVEDRAEPGADRDPEGRPAAHRRGTLIRAWAGLVAVWGLASAVTRSSFNADFETIRVVPAWLGDAAILILAIVLVERAFRRDSGAFLFAAAIGFLAALSDFNLSYLSDIRELGLLIEGGILLGVGVAAARLRRRMSRGRPEPGPPDPGPDPDGLPSDATVPTGPLGGVGATEL